MPDTTSDCIEGTGARLKGGHRLITNHHGPDLGGKQVLGHRAAWYEANGIIPEGMIIRHACDNPGCINLEHLLIGTQADNVQDMIERGRHAAQNMTHCKNGHEFTDDNTLRANGKRHCRQCRAAASRRYRNTQTGQRQSAAPTERDNQ